MARAWGSCLFASFLTMRRRQFGAVCVGAVGWAARRAPVLAQQHALPTVGYLSISSRADDLFHERFLAGLHDRGYVDERTVRIEPRFADGNGDRLADLAAELVALGVNVIVTYAGVGVSTARKATSTIPIVVATGPDLVKLGFANSLARPGGNMTGLRYLAGDAFAKRLELLKEVDPAMTEVGVLFQRGSPFAAPTMESMRPTAKALGLQLRPLEVGPAEYSPAFAAWTEGKVSGLVVHDNPEFIANAKQIAALAAKHKLRSIGSLEHTANGGLLAYSVDFGELFYRSAYFVDRILKGEKPGDLPIEQPTKFQFVINLAAARTLGLTVPPTLLARAEEVIE